LCRATSALRRIAAAAELEQVIKIVGRSPRGYAPGASDALKEQRHRAVNAEIGRTLPLVVVRTVEALPRGFGRPLYLIISLFIIPTKIDIMCDDCLFGFSRHPCGVPEL
jgi:hypothetical protein